MYLKKGDFMLDFYSLDHVTASVKGASFQDHHLWELSAIKNKPISLDSKNDWSKHV